MGLIRYQLLCLFLPMKRSIVMIQRSDPNDSVKFITMEMMTLVIGTMVMAITMAMVIGHRLSIPPRRSDISKII